MRMVKLSTLVLLGTLWAAAGFAQTATNTPTATPTLTPTATRTLTPTNTRTATPTVTNTANVSISEYTGKRLTAKRLQDVNTYPERANLPDLFRGAIRSVMIGATNATALGRDDIGTVVGILCFNKTGRASCTKGLEEPGVDYTVANGDVTPVGDHSTELWLICYRP